MSTPVPDSLLVNNADVQSWLTVINGIFIFFMQVGFVVLETGSGRAKNVRNILLKNMVVAMLSAICWWAIGYAFAYGQSAGGVIGINQFFYEGGANFPYSDKPWFFSWVFAIGCIAIVSGPLAERTRLGVYPIYTLAMALVVHPIVVHWVWNRDSWLNTMATCRVLDYAGGIPVHMVGGLFGLVGALFVGPRLGRFEDGIVKALPGHDMAFVTLGTFMLWFGWYGFNTGSAFAYLNANAAETRRVAMTTTLSASAAGLTALLTSSFLTGSYDLRMCCNGVLSGLVTATPIAGFVMPWVGPVMGTIAGFAYIAYSMLLLRLRIDDPLDASAVHFGAGMLSTLLLGFFAHPDFVDQLTARPCGGVFYTRLGWQQLGMQVLGITVSGIFTSISAVLVFWLLRRYNHLRVDQATELAGIDNIDHGGPAYPEYITRNGAGNNGSIRGGIMH